MSKKKKYTIEVIHEENMGYYVDYPAMPAFAALGVIESLTRDLTQNSEYGKALMRKLVKHVIEQHEEEGSVFNELN